MLAETCYDLWSGQIDAATPELRRRMYQWFQHAWHTSDDLCQELLWEVQQELFHDPEFLRSNIDQLDRMIQDEQVRQDQRYSRLPQLVLQKLERMEELGLPQEKVQRVEREHWALPDIRRRVISRLLEEKPVYRGRGTASAEQEAGPGMAWSGLWVQPGTDWPV